MPWKQTVEQLTIPFIFCGTQNGPVRRRTTKTRPLDVETLWTSGTPGKSYVALVLRLRSIPGVPVVGVGGKQTIDKA
jgi:hypothetical protein